MKALAHNDEVLAYLRNGSGAHTESYLIRDTIRTFDRLSAQLSDVNGSSDVQALSEESRAFLIHITAQNRKIRDSLAELFNGKNDLEVPKEITKFIEYTQLLSAGFHAIDQEEKPAGVKSDLAKVSALSDMLGAYATGLKAMARAYDAERPKALSREQEDPETIHTDRAKRYRSGIGLGIFSDSKQ